MKRLFLTLALFAALLTTTVSAKDIVVSGCTKDQKAVVLTIDVKDETSDAVAADIRQVFASTARSLTAAVLLSQEGFVAFINGLTEEDYDAIQEIAGPQSL